MDERIWPPEFLIMFSNSFTAMKFLIPVLLNLSVAIGTHVANTPPQPTPPKERQKVVDFTPFTASCTLIYKVRGVHVTEGCTQLILKYAHPVFLLGACRDRDIRPRRICVQSEISQFQA